MAGIRADIRACIRACVRACNRVSIRVGIRFCTGAGIRSWTINNILQIATEADRCMTCTLANIIC